VQLVTTELHKANLQKNLSARETAVSWKPICKF